MSGPGKIILRAAGNYANHNIYHFGTATKSAPVQTVLNLTNQNGYTNSSGYTYNNYFLVGGVISYARTVGIELAARLYVIDDRDNSIKWVSDEITSDTQISSHSEDANQEGFVYSEEFAEYLGSIVKY